MSFFIQVLSLGALGAPRLTPLVCIPASQNNWAGSMIRSAELFALNHKDLHFINKMSPFCCWPYFFGTYNYFLLSLSVISTQTINMNQFWLIFLKLLWSHSFPHSTESLLHHAVVAVELDLHGVASAGDGIRLRGSTIFLRKCPVRNLEIIS